MALLLELPSALEEELVVEASREGVSTSEQAAFLLQLITALIRDGRKTPFQSVVKAYLRQNSLDADRLAGVFGSLVAYCLRNTAQDSMPDQTSDNAIDPMNPEVALSMLRNWRSQESNCSIDHDVEVSIHELPPLEHLVQRSRRMNRSSILGKYAYLGLSSEDFAREKQMEIDREDRKFWE